MYLGIDDVIRGAVGAGACVQPGAGYGGGGVRLGNVPPGDPGSELGGVSGETYMRRDIGG